MPEEPPEASVAQSREESSSHSETESFAPPTETSITNNDCVSEGQWIISILSEGEVPHMKVDEGMLRWMVRSDGSYFTPFISI